MRDSLCCATRYASTLLGVVDDHEPHGPDEEAAAQDSEGETFNEFLYPAPSGSCISGLGNGHVLVLPRLNLGAGLQCESPRVDMLHGFLHNLVVCQPLCRHEKGVSFTLRALLHVVVVFRSFD